jgi:hypothetical protein
MSSELHASAARAALALAALLVSVGCVTITPPPRFLVVDEGCDDLKAVTPEDSRLWVRTFDDDDRGGLPFWQDALKEDLTKNRGYVVMSEAETAAGSVKGHEYVLETTVNGRPVRELLVLFVTEGWFSDSVHVIEYVADKDAFDKELPAVRAAVQTYKP